MAVWCEELSSVCLKWDEGIESTESIDSSLIGGFICAVRFPHSFSIITLFWLHSVFSSFVWCHILAVLLVEPASVFLSGLMLPCFLFVFLYRFQILLRSLWYIPLHTGDWTQGLTLIGKHAITERPPQIKHTLCFYFLKVCKMGL